MKKRFCPPQKIQRQRKPSVTLSIRRNWWFEKPLSLDRRCGRNQMSWLVLTDTQKCWKVFFSNVPFLRISANFWKYLVPFPYGTSKSTLKGWLWQHFRAIAGIHICRLLLQLSGILSTGKHSTIQQAPGAMWAQHSCWLHQILDLLPSRYPTSTLPFSCETILFCRV